MFAITACLIAPPTRDVFRGWHFPVKAKAEELGAQLRTRVGSIGRDSIVLFTQCRHMNPDQL